MNVGSGAIAAAASRHYGGPVKAEGLAGAGTVVVLVQRPAPFRDPYIVARLHLATDSFHTIQQYANPADALAGFGMEVGLLT